MHRPLATPLYWFREVEIRFDRILREAIYCGMQLSIGVDIRGNCLSGCSEEPPNLRFKGTIPLVELLNQSEPIKEKNRRPHGERRLL